MQTALINGRISSYAAGVSWGWVVVVGFRDENPTGP